MATDVAKQILSSAKGGIVSPEIKVHFETELSKSLEFIKSKDFDSAWTALARAHILGQFDAIPHFKVHWHMFRLGIASLNTQEILGQIPRMILAIPGSLTGKAPKGNTGLSNVGIFEPMDVPEDLQKILNPRL
ncbi:DUF3703 domain-containing protein [Bdellovibrio bacteriovorus]|uniref:DUF3703 domain-containing protein n=1 Tax=Bdellovibrio bacteriovorus TaxID=959 RepID=UPI003AA94C63